MDNYESYLKEKQYSSRTIIAHLNGVNKFKLYMSKENLTISIIDYNDILEYVSKLNKRNIKPSTQKIKIGILKTYFNYLLKTGKVNHNPVLDVKINGSKNNTIINALTEDQLEAIYSTFTNYESKWKERDEKAHTKHCVVLGLIIYQGLSSSELNRLLITDFNLQQGTLVLPEGNRSGERILKLDIQQLYFLTQYFNDNIGEKLIQGSTRILLETVTHKLQRVTTSNYTIKQLRESRIVIWLRQHGLRKTQYYGGFKYISSLEKYRISEIEDLRKKLEDCFRS